MGTLLIAMMISIVSAGAEERTRVQQRYQNNRGQNTEVRYQRRLTFMCLNTKSNSNTFMMFHGYGNNDNLLNGMDASHKYNGSLREFVLTPQLFLSPTPSHEVDSL